MKKSVIAAASLLGLVHFSAAAYPAPIKYFGTGTLADSTVFKAGTVDGRIAIPYYVNYANLPTGWNEQMWDAALKHSMKKWEQVCNVRFVYQGRTNVETLKDIGQGGRTANIKSVIGFQDMPSDVSANGVVLNSLFRKDLPAESMINDLRMSPSPHVIALGLDGYYSALNTLTHELGHMLGLSDINQYTYPQGWDGVWKHTVMYNKPVTSGYEHYKATLRGADVKGCQSMYGAPADQDIHRVLNYLEGEDYNWPTLGKRLGQLTQYTTAPIDGKQLAYRHYPDTNVYIGISLNENPKMVYMLRNGSSKLESLGTYSKMLESAKSNSFVYEGITFY